jgi:hypothetical protein
VDTREKILSIEAAARLLRERPGARVVTGYFDPLLATDARLLQEMGGRLIVAVRTPERELLPYRARVELVASLGSVEFVVPEECLTAIPHENVVRLEETHRQSTAELIELVRRRSG